MMATMKSPILCLPFELLEKIRSHIHSLEAHVHLSLTLKSLYNDKFWKLACYSAGWGMSEMPIRARDDIAKTARKQDAPVELWAALARLVVKDAKTFDGWREVGGWTAKDGMNRFQSHLP